MNRKFLIFFGAIALIVGLVVAGCFVDEVPGLAGGAADAYKDASGAPVSKSGTGTAKGYMTGDDVKVVLTLTNGKISSVEITGADASCSTGGPIVNAAKKFIVDNNSVDVDAMTRPTDQGTKKGIKQAGQAALKDAGVDIK